MNSSPASAQRVLCYMPYNRWALHGQWEMTILHALKLRGADVTYVLCDGLYSDCDMFWGATERRPANACVGCQAHQVQLVSSMGMDFRWLGRYLAPDEERDARRWEQSLARDELLTATYGDWPVAEWVVGSVHSHFRRATLDVGEPNVERIVRSYLHSGLVACFALDRLIEETRPDVLFQFNGRVSSTRVAFELARRRGIRVVTHERGPRTETISLTVNGSTLSLKPHWRHWRDWGDVPLVRDELLAVERFLDDRAHGKNVNWAAYDRGPQEVEEARARLTLDPARPTWVLFTSSDDEVIAENTWKGGFDSHFDWVERTVAYAADHPEIDLVIRVHPNTGSRRSVGANVEQLEQFEALAARLPENVRLIAPDDDLSAYTLMEIATVGLVYHSTAGLELACKGRETVIAGGHILGGTPFVRTVEDAGGYETILDSLLELPIGHVDPEIRRLAYRQAYGSFFRVGIDFPLVRMPIPTHGDLAWSSLDELQPGREPSLDRCARIILDGEDSCPPPAQSDRARTEADEDEFFARAATVERRFTALAFAEELIEDETLLRAWGSTFSAADPATLVIHTPADATERLVEAVTRAGLDGDGTPDLVAVDAELAAADAVFSRRALDGALAAAPRFDDATVAELGELVRRQPAAG